MSGKAILFLVVGFSLIFLVLGQNFGRISTEGIDNSSNYFERTVAHNIASSGANIGANQIFLNPNWTAGLNNISFDGGVLNVSVDIIDAFQNIRRVNSIGIFKDDTSIVQITLQPSSFAQFAYFSENENGIHWITGDTVGGRFHTQDFLYSDGHPVFIGKATSFRGIKYVNNDPVNDKPVFDGTFGRDSIPIPSTSISNLENTANANGHTFMGNDTVSLNFMGDSIRYTTATNTTTRVQVWNGRRYVWENVTTTARITQTVLASTFAPNGVIFADNAILRIQGKVTGQYTVGASGTSSGTGNIYIDNDITYTTDPQTNPSSTDLLGIVAEQNVYVAKTSNNLNDGINIDAAIFCKDGGFGAEDYSSIPVAGGPINLYGGICQETRQAVGTYQSVTNRYTHVTTLSIQSGYYKHYYYDPRLASAFPPSYPATGKFQIVSWYESNSKL